ncbi:alpha-amylase-related protein-like [Rhagoletis pomonella]|uniref:alpha-amylase-related protein-like n=1 Tax=Rhagoletis pomonella TaxID=28610 RepID=UPI0017818E72|nr:alpha-amylase-related protein-like [Rhagoletis pomonella]
MLLNCYALRVIHTSARLRCAIAIDKSLQIEQPDQPLLDHTQSHFLPNRSGIVQLFEWKYADIAAECEQFLGPRGFAGVQVSPVTEHLLVRSATTPPHAWWERYQPLSFQMASRSGGEEEFQQMTRACNDAGVRVYVDVVLNHMAGAYDEETASGQRLLEGFAGSTANASSYDFPAVHFTSRHFHKPCELLNYMDAHEVRNCALNGWPDLNHNRLDVRGNLTEFLNRLVDMGVAGFRVDAAKYIWPIDIKLLFKDVKYLNSEEFGFPENARPFVYQDVVDLGIDSISKTEYSSYGIVTEYLYAAELANVINGKAPLSTLINWGPAMGFLPHQQALVFVDSHDVQRDRKLLGANRLLSYKQPRKYIIATAFMLAHPYGRVKRIMSSYYFAAEQPEQGPPMEESEEEVEEEETDADAEGNEVEAEGNEADGDEAASTADVSPPQPHVRSPTFDASTGRCEYASGWVCEHRWPPIVHIVELANTLNEIEDGVINFQTDGSNHIAFCRGNKAFFAFNNDAQLTYEAEVETCLPSGVYCDVISGGRAETATDCLGKRIVVDMQGKARITLPAVLGAGEDEAADGSDYDEADAEENDAYGIAAGADGEFGVLAVYYGSRLEDEVPPEKQKGGDDTEAPPADELEEDTATELAVEDVADESEVVEEVTEITDGSDEDVSPEKLEDAVVEKSAKLEEAATDASVENEDEDVGEAAAVEGEEETSAGGGEEEEETGEDPPAEEEPAVEEEAAVEEQSAEDEEPAVEEELAQDEEPAIEEEPTVEEGEDAEEVGGDAADNAETAEAEGEAANAEKPAESVADELAADESAAADEPPVEGDAAGEDAKEEGILDEANGVLKEVEKEVTDAVNKVKDKVTEHIGKDGPDIKTSIEAGAENLANKTKVIIAKAGFNTNSATTSESIQLCSLTILISSILINLYST